MVKSGLPVWILFVVGLVLARPIFGQENFQEGIVLSTWPGNSYGALNQDHFYILEGTPYDIFTKQPAEIPSYAVSFTLSSAIFTSCDTDYAKNILYAYDQYTSTIYAIDQFDWKTNFTQSTKKVFHRGVSSPHVKLAVDWVSHNVYWVDPNYRWIVVQTGINQNGGKQSYYKILFNEDLIEPIGIAVDAKNGYLFWSDIGGVVKKIERSRLDGSDRTPILSSTNIFPVSIEADPLSSKIYWVDQVRQSVEVADYDGRNQRHLKRLVSSSLYDLAIFRQTLTVVDTRDGTLRLIHKDTGKSISSSYHLFNDRSMRSKDFAISVAMYSDETQPSKNNYCATTSCDHLCVSTVNKAVCLCQEGYQLNQSTTCTEKEGAYHRAVVIATPGKMCLADIRGLNNYDDLDNRECFPLPSTDAEVRFMDMDMTERKIYFAIDSTIYSVTVDSPHTTTRLEDSTSSITGLAYDWTKQDLYLSDQDSIFLYNTDVGSMVTIVRSTLPRDLVLFPVERKMFWISGNNNVQIESSNMDGTQMKAMLSDGNIINPTSLTVDRKTQQLYWFDNNKVWRMNINGSGLVGWLDVPSDENTVMLHAYQSHMILTTLKKQTNTVHSTSLVTIDIDRPSLQEVSPYQTDQKMTAVGILDSVLQPTKTGPCDVLNGGCEQVCVPEGTVRMCRCGYGYKLDSNGLTCSSEPLQNKFLYVADWTHNQIFQVSLVGNDVRALDAVSIKNPMGVAFNHVTKKVIWSDRGGKAIHSANMDGSQYRLLTDLGYENSHPERFAVDFASGDIYYTAITILGRTGFTGVGVYTADGTDKKLVTYRKPGLPRAIVLDPSEGLLFWSDHQPKNPSLRKVNMDGSGEKIMIDSGLVWPNGLAIDTKEKLLYMTDGYENTIKQCSYAGVCTTIYTDTTEAHLMDIDLLGNYLYFTAWNRQYITKMHIKNPMNTVKLGEHTDLGRLDALTVYDSSFFKVTLPNTTPTPVTEKVHPGQEGASISESPSKAPLIGGIVGGIVALALLILLLLLFLKCRHRKSDNTEPTQFENPYYNAAHDTASVRSKVSRSSKGRDSIASRSSVSSKRTYDNPTVLNRDMKDVPEIRASNIYETVTDIQSPRSHPVASINPVYQNA